MRITKDNIEGILYHLDIIRRQAPKKDWGECIKHATHALKILGFTQRGESDPSDNVEKLISELVFFWHTNRQAYYKWLNWQDVSRDWYANAEIKRARGKINKTLKELQLCLLDVVEASGKVYDK